MVIQVLYSTVLKHLPVIDLAVVSSGFLLRAIAGGVAVGVPLSQWFLLVASFGSLFMVAGKRYSELVSVGAEAGTRKSLDRYSASYLRFVWILAAVLVSPPTACGPSRTAATGPSAYRGPRSRSLRSPSACCSTPWRWTPGRRASRRTSCCTTACCKDWE